MMRKVYKCIFTVVCIMEAKDEGTENKADKSIEDFTDSGRGIVRNEDSPIQYGAPKPLYLGGLRHDADFYASAFWRNWQLQVDFEESIGIRPHHNGDHGWGCKRPY